MKTLFSIMAMSCLLANTPKAQAASITYNLVIGSVGAGSVSGLITTDGNLGFLAVSDIVNWDIMLKPNPGTPFTLRGPLSGNNSGLETSGSGLSANSTGLFFDFANPGFALFQNPAPGSGINYFCFAGNGTVCGGFNGPAINDGTNVFGVNTQPESLSTVLIGTSGVPEPSTLSVLSLAARV